MGSEGMDYMRNFPVVSKRLLDRLTTDSAKN